MGMVCPRCGEKLETRDTRKRADNSVKRRRVCPAPGCGFRGTTIEVFAEGATKPVEMPTEDDWPLDD